MTEHRRDTAAGHKSEAAAVIAQFRGRAEWPRFPMVLEVETEANHKGARLWRVHFLYHAKHYRVTLIDKEMARYPDFRLALRRQFAIQLPPPGDSEARMHWSRQVKAWTGNALALP